MQYQKPICFKVLNSMPTASAQYQFLVDPELCPALDDMKAEFLNGQLQICSPEGCDANNEPDSVVIIKCAEFPGTVNLTVHTSTGRPGNRTCVQSESCLFDISFSLPGDCTIIDIDDGGCIPS